MEMQYILATWSMPQEQKAEFQKAVRQFMQDNGYKFSVAGRAVACNDFEGWYEAHTSEGKYDPMFVGAVKATIYELKED